MFGILALGFRHGFDPDHVAAITDISSSQLTTRWRTFLYCTLYACGHATMLLALGAALWWFGIEIPNAERVIGATLVLMGAYVVWQTVRGQRPKSRAHLLQTGFHRIRNRIRPVTQIKHAHPEGRSQVVTTHTHTLDTSYGVGGVVGVGLVHGIGAETPTQVLALSAGAWALPPFILGLFLGNTLVALVSTGLLTQRWLRPLNLAVGLFSLAVGIPYLLGVAPIVAW